VIGATLGKLWTLLLWRHAALVGLCLLGFWAQMKYRVPGRLLVLLLPTIGLALVVLSFAMLAGSLLRGTAKDNPYRRTFQAIDWGATAIVLVYVALSALLFLNGFFDRSRGAERVSEVVAVEREEVDVGWQIGYAWADLTAWWSAGGVARVLVRNAEHDRLWPGQSVIVRVHPGAYGVEWVERIERDEEKHNRRVLATVPTASQAWKDLVRFYLDRRRWEEAMTAAREYLALYPNDLDFALGTASEFGQARRHAELVRLLEMFEKVLARRPNFPEIQEQLRQLRSRAVPTPPERPGASRPSSRASP
jgi:tetratricopeptide (TPR) repeat protein